VHKPGAGSAPPDPAIDASVDVTDDWNSDDTQFCAADGPASFSKFLIFLPVEFIQPIRNDISSAALNWLLRSWVGAFSATGPLFPKWEL
jgi:hypothetical protein